MEHGHAIASALSPSAGDKVEEAYGVFRLPHHGGARPIASLASLVPDSVDGVARGRRHFHPRRERRGRPGDRRQHTAPQVVRGFSGFDPVVAINADPGHEAGSWKEVLSLGIEDRAGGKDELGSASAISRRSVGRPGDVSESHASSLSVSQRPRKRNHVEARSVFMFDRYALDRPRHALEARAHREGQSSNRVFRAILDIEYAAHPHPAQGRLELDLRIDTEESGRRHRGPRGGVQAPIVLGLLAGAPPIDAIVDQPRQKQTRNKEHGHARGQPGPRPHPPHDRITVAPGPGGDGDGEKQQRGRGNDGAVQSKRVAVHLEEAHVGPPKGAPQRPVGEPRHAPAQEQSRGSHQRSQADHVGHKSVAGDRERRGDECRPRHEGRREQKAPDEDEWHHVNRSGLLQRLHRRRHRGTRREGGRKEQRARQPRAEDDRDVAHRG